MFTRTHLVPLFLPALALAAGVRAQAPSPPALLAYPFLCPTCNTEQMITLRYGADAGSAVVSVAETHATSAEPGLHPNRDATVAQPGEWIASPRTGGRPGRIQRWEGEVGTDFIEVQLHSPLVEGRRYAATRRLTPAE